MSGALALLITVIFGLAGIVFWNKSRIKGKMLCYFVRKDKSLVGKLCELKDDFVIFGRRAYDVYPDFVRVARFPMGWPSILQELVPCALYDEEDAIPLDWINLDNRLERAMELKAALDENWLRKLVQEAAAVGGLAINWRRIFPLVLIGIGVVGLLLIMTKGCAPTLPVTP